MNSNELQKGRIYTDHDGVNAYMFVELRNDQIATFKACEYDDGKGDYIATAETIYLTVNELKRLEA